MIGGLTQETLDLLRAGVLGLRKDATTVGLPTSLGIVGYDLEDEAKLIYPAHTPIINEMPRVGLTGRQFGTAAHWKSIININTANVFGGVAEGKRGGQISYQEKDFTATYAGLGLESFVNFESEYAARGYDDIVGTAQRTLLQATKVAEEQMVLWGNTSLAGGTTPTPTVTDAGGSGSAFTATVQTVKCVALSALGLLLAGGPFGPTNSDVHTTFAVQDQITRNNADGSSDTINGGHAIISASGTVTPTATHSVQAVVTGVAGAAGYAWYLGANGGATLYLTAITVIPKVVFSAGAGDNPSTAMQQSTFTGNGSDRFKNALAFDGLITQCINNSGWPQGGGMFGDFQLLSPSPGGSYTKSLAGAALTFTNGSCNEIDAMLQWMWEAYKVYPDELWMSAYQAAKLTNGIVGSSAPLYQIQVAGSQGDVQAGFLVTSYLNKFALGGATRLRIRVHPYMPNSWIFANTKTISDKLAISNVPSVSRIKARQEYYSIAWPVTTRQRQYGVYVDEVLECYVPIALAFMYDVA